MSKMINYLKRSEGGRRPTERSVLKFPNFDYRLVGSNCKNCQKYSYLCILLRSIDHPNGYGFKEALMAINYHETYLRHAMQKYLIDRNKRDN